MGGSQEELEYSAQAAACVAADPVFSSLDASGTPIIVASGNPLHIDFLNDSARAVFREDLGSLGERLFRDDEPGARRLAEIVGELRSDRGPRLERLRFHFGDLAQTLIFLCRTLETASGVAFVIAVLGVHADSPAGNLSVATAETGASNETAAQAASASRSEVNSSRPPADNVVALRAPDSARAASDAPETLSSSELLAFDEIARTLKEGGASQADSAREFARKTPDAQRPVEERRDPELLAPGPEHSVLALARTLEEKLARAKSDNALLGAAFDLSHTPLAIITVDGKIVRANARLAAYFGAEARDVESRTLASLLNPADAQSLAQRIALLRPDESLRLPLSRAPPGDALPVDLALRALPAQGKPTILVSLEAQEAGCSSSDSAVEAARLAAESANAAKSDFLTRVSHEIRTPLNAIIGFAEAMMEERLGPLGSPRYKEYLKDMHASGAHVLSLVNDLLDLSKIEAGKMELSFARVDANAVIAECASIMQAQANQARVVLRLALAPSLPPLRADTRALKQILLNLLSNAVKFNEPGGQVIVSSALTDAGSVVIRVKDTGIGMSEEDVATALEPFRQVDTARKASGTGLGLPLTKALIEANHASFSITSSRNEGTLIEIAFAPPQLVAAE